MVGITTLLLPYPSKVKILPYLTKNQRSPYDDRIIERKGGERDISTIMGNDLPSNPGDVTGGNSQEHLTGTDPKQPQNTTEEELDIETKKGFQVALQKKSEALKERERLLGEKEEELKNLKEEKRLKKLQEMDETERIQAERDTLAEENAKLKMSQFALKELSKRGIKTTDPIAEIVMESPWAIPYIRRTLQDSPTWAEVIKAVENRLPSYLDSLVSNSGVHRESEPAPTPPSSPTPPSGGSDVERPTVPTAKRVWTRKEIKELSDADYLKHREEIAKAAAEGRVVD